MSNDPDFDALLEGIAKAQANDAEANARILDNHLSASSLVIANVAAIQAIQASPEDTLVELVRATSENPT